MHLVNDVDLEFALRWRIFDFLTDFADIFDAVVGSGVNFNDVDASACQNIPADVAFVAGFALRGQAGTVDCAGEYFGGGGFACAARAAEQIGMGGAARFHLVFQCPHDMLLPDDAAERLRTEFSV